MATVKTCPVSEAILDEASVLVRRYRESQYSAWDESISIDDRVSITSTWEALVAALDFKTSFKVEGFRAALTEAGSQSRLDAILHAHLESVHTSLPGVPEGQVISRWNLEVEG